MSLKAWIFVALGAYVVLIAVLLLLNLVVKPRDHANNKTRLKFTKKCMVCGVSVTKDSFPCYGALCNKCADENEGTCIYCNSLITRHENRWNVGHCNECAEEMRRSYL